jgi:hypothetical protein
VCCIELGVRGHSPWEDVLQTQQIIIAVIAAIIIIIIIIIAAKRVKLALEQTTKAQRRVPV